MSTVTGTSDNDILEGTPGADQINGLGGDDRLDGKGGDDTLDGGAGNDFLIGGIGNDTVHGGEGADTFLAEGSSGDDHLFGDAGDDTFQETQGNDVLDGGEGADTFRVEYNDVTVLATGGAGQDTYVVGGPPNPSIIHDYRVVDFESGPAGDRINVDDLLNQSSLLGYRGGNPFAQGFLRLFQSGADTLLQWDRDGAAGGAYTAWETVLTLQNRLVSSFTADNFAGGIPPDGSPVPGQTLDGTSGDDTLTGGFFDDQINGLDGNDRLTGGGGDDAVNGGAGNDFIFGGFGTDTVFGGAGSDTYSFSSLPASQSVIVAMDFDAGEDLIDVFPLLSTSASLGYTGGNPFGQGFLQLVPSGLDTQLQWDRDGAGAGYDWATVLTLKNTAPASITSGNFVGEIPPDGSAPSPLTLNGGSGGDTLVGGVAGDQINGHDGDDLLYGEWGDDQLDGGPGNDQLVGGAGNDTVLGGEGDDAFTFSLTPDGSADDASTAGDDTLVGGAGNDIFLDPFGDNVFDGGSGDDLFAVLLQNATGTATGGTGRDRYRIDPTGAGRDFAVTDFAAGENGDLLDVDALLSLGFGYSGGNPFEQGYLRLLQSGPDTLVQFDSTGAAFGSSFVTQLTLQGVDAASITSANFVGRLIVGTPNDDVLLGSLGDDTLRGLAGNDSLDGSLGADLMEGGPGADLYFVDNAGDSVVEADNTLSGLGLPHGLDLGSNIDKVVSSVNFTLGNFIENLDLKSGAGNIAGTGNALNNILAGNEGDNSLAGDLGNDAFDGGAGFDVAIFAGAYRGYSLIGNPTAAATLEGTEGTDNFTAVEKLAFLDGSLNFDPASHVAQVERLYMATLDRRADPLGLNYWLGRLDAGAGLNVMAGSFVVSAEFQARYGALDNAQFVNQLYLNVLHRTADPDGLAFWSGQLDAGMARGQVVTGFSESGEFIQNNMGLVNSGLWDSDETAASVARLYWVVLGRAPDVAGLDSAVAAVKGGQSTLLQLATEMATGAEFQAHYGTLNDYQFFRQLILNAEGFPVDYPLAFPAIFPPVWAAPRGVLALGFSESPELQFQPGFLDQIDHGVVATDTLTGTSGNDVIAGSALYDTLIGLAGDDTLSGRAGLDAALYSGAFRQYGLTGNPLSTATLQGPEGADSLAGIEQLVFLDGSLHFDPNSHIAQVERLYLATFNRLPDPLGLNHHLAHRDAGTNLWIIADEFVASTEFQAAYGTLDNTQFVDLLYQNILHRPRDASETYWLDQLNLGSFMRGRVVAGFSESPEFIQNNIGLVNVGLWDIDEVAGSVARLYLGTLGRAADVEGLKFHTNAIKSGQYTLAQDAGIFVASAEFQAIYGSLDDPTFVNQLYLNVLHRAGDPGGLAFWTGKLQSQEMTRGAVTLEFTESQENQLQTIGQIDHGIQAVDAHFP